MSISIERGRGELRKHCASGHLLDLSGSTGGRREEEVRGRRR